MDRREELFGIAEKRLKDFGPKSRRRVTSLTLHRLRKQR
jgi:hypothetical protein